MTILDAAIAYTRRGWKVIPIPHRKKNPGRKGWQKLRLAEPQLPKYFGNKLQNIGVLLGEPSHWLIDIDLDHPRAVALAPEYLPETQAVFGRPGNPNSHWLYHVSSPQATKRFNCKPVGMLVELRSTGLQTVFPPSTHESGEPITWQIPDADPATVDPDEIVAAVESLANAVRAELGEPSKRSKKARAQPIVSAETPVAPLPTQARVERCLAAMLRMTVMDHNDGSRRLYACACRTVEHDLDDATAIRMLHEYSHQRPFTRAWSDDEILQRIRQAENRCQRGEALRLDDDGYIALGGCDPGTGRIVLSPKRTLPTAEAFVREFFDHPEGQTLFNHAGKLIRWQHNCYREIEEQAIRKNLQRWLHGSLRYGSDRKSKELMLVPFDSNPTTVNAALESIRSHTHLPATQQNPSWLVGGNDLPSPRDILACRSDLLYLPSLRRLPSTPNFFTSSALEFDFDPEADPPMPWYEFLHEIFDGDSEGLDLLQEWCGYCLTGDTSQQKMMLIVGPKRSGKGTIARVLSHLIGHLNVSGPTTASLAGQFGLQPLIGKTLAIVSDARFHGDKIATVVERLLCISGEDTLTIDRKFLGSATMKLPTRFMFLTNEFPRFNDASGALVGRFLILKLTKSFYGREDPQLLEKLLPVLPGVLNWAIEGWQRLRERGHFVIPQSSEDAVRDMEDLASPVGAFVREACDVGPGHRAWVDDLYSAWKSWCERDGRSMITTRQSFGRDLAAAVPGIASRRGTGMARFYEGIGLKTP